MYNPDTEFPAPKGDGVAILKYASRIAALKNMVLCETRSRRRRYCSWQIPRISTQGRVR
jgi:hypothetical protein